MSQARTIDERIERIDWKRDTVKGARIAVDRWFTEIDGKPAFLPGHGQAIALDRETFLAVRHGAYVKVSELVMSADRWAGMLVIGFMLALAIGGGASQLPPSELRSWVMAIALIAGVAHGLYGLYEFVRRWREIETVRQSTAFALRGRVPSHVEPGDRRVRRNILPALMAATTFLFLAWLLSSDVLGMIGLGRFVAPAEPVFMLMIVAIGVLGLANQWIEARRKA